MRLGSTSGILQLRFMKGLQLGPAAWLSSEKPGVGLLDYLCLGRWKEGLSQDT